MGGLLMLVFWILVLVGVAAIVRWILPRSKNGSPAGPESPLEILKTRYARGEIDKAEFEARKKDILGS